jgi:hypothetical protein
MVKSYIIQKPIKHHKNHHKNHGVSPSCYTHHTSTGDDRITIIFPISVNATLRASAVHDGITEDLHGAAKGDLATVGTQRFKWWRAGKNGWFS